MPEKNTILLQSQLRYKLLFVILLIFSVLSNKVKASHLMGGDFTYEFVSKNGNTMTYKISMKIYRDCNSGSQFPATAAIGIYYANNNSSYGSLTLNRASGYSSEKIITPTCIPGAGICIAEMLYENLISFPATNSTGFYLSAHSCCRNASIANISSPSTTGMGWLLYIPPANSSLFNNSVKFSSKPLPFICVGDTVSFNHLAYDTDGDSLAYSLVTPYASSGSPNGIVATTPNLPNITYNTVSGYTSSKPLGNDSYIGLNAATGEIKIYAGSAKVAVVSVEIKEYRKNANGTYTYVGSVRRDLQIITKVCPNYYPPKFTLPSGWTSADYYNRTMNALDTLCFDVKGVDSLGDSLFISASGAIFDGSDNQCTPFATFAKDSADSIITQKFCWTPGCCRAGKSYIFTVDLLDNNCGSRQVTFSIKVNNVIIKEPQLRCVDILSNTSIKLSWNAPSTEANLKRYLIYRRTTGSFVKIDSVNIGVGSYTDNGVSNAYTTQYQYLIKSVNICDSLSAGDTITTIKVNITKPNSFTSYITWNNPKTTVKPTYIKVYRYTASGGWQYLDSIRKDTMYYFAKKCSDTVQFKITAYDSLGGCQSQSMYSSTITLEDLIPPADMTFTRATITSSNKVRLDFKRNDSLDTKTYYIYRKNVGAGTYTLIDSVQSNNSATYTVYDNTVNVNSGPELPSYKVVAKDSCGNIGGSSQIHTPVNLRGTPGNLAANLVWRNYVGFAYDSLFVYKYNTSGVPVRYKTKLAADTTFSDSGLVCNKVYTYILRFVNFKQDSTIYAESDTIQITPYDSVAPSAPKVNLVSVASDSKVDLWFYPSASTDVVNYDIYRITNGGTASLVKTINNPTLSGGFVKYTDSSLNTLVNRYCYYVIARDSCKNLSSPASNMHCDIQLSGSAGNNRVRLTWMNYIGRGIKNYKVNKLTTSGYVTVYTGNGTDSIYTDSNALSCGKYTYQIVGYDSTGNYISYSDTTTLQPYDSVAPSAPVVNLVSVSSDTKVDLWFYPSASTDVKKYEVYQIKNGGTATLVATLNNPTVTAGLIKYTDLSLNTLTNRYCYYVVARDSCSNLASPASNIHCDIQLSGSAGNNRVKLTWMNYIGRGIKNYKVNKLTTSGYVTIYTGNGTDSFYTDSNSLSCGKYTYQIVALDSSGALLSYSDSTTIQPYDSTAPIAPVVNLVTVSSDTKVDVWFYPSASTDVKKYEIYQIKNGGSATLVATMLNPTLVSGKIKYIDSNLTCLKDRYCYYVVARDSCSNLASAASNIHCDVQLNNTVGNKKVFLSWTKYIGRGIKNYKVTKLTQSGYTTIYTGNGTDSIYTDSNGLSCGIYTYQIQAVDSTGLLISYSDSTTAHPYDSTKPIAPVVNLVSVLTDTSVDIFYYKSSANVQKYELYQSTNGGAFFLATTFIDTTTTTNYLKYTLKNLNCLKDKYCFYLIARDSCSNLASVASNIHCDIQLVGTPGNNKAYINWNKYFGRGIMTYRIRKKGSAGFVLKYTGNGTDSTFIDSVGVNCGPNYYKVEAWDSSFTYVSYSDTICVIPNDTVPPIVASIKKVTLLTQNKIYLHWAKSSADVNRYILYRSVNNTTLQPYDTLTASDTSYIDSFANTSLNYYSYSIEALDSCKSLSSGLSPIHSSINLAGTFDFCQKKYDVYWNKYTNWKNGVSSYQILRSVNGSGYSVIASVTSTDSHYVDTVSYNRNYKYKVKAYELNGGFESSISDSVTLFYKPIKGPKLNVISKTATSTTNGTVRVSFDITYYDTLIKYARLYHSSTGTTGSYTLVKDSIPKTQTYFDHNNINTSTSDHYYYMVNVDSCGLNTDSNGIHKTMNLSINQRKLRNTLYWTKYKGFTIQKYFIEKTDTNNNFVTIDSVLSTDTSYLDYPAPCNEYVTYRVSALDNTGNYISLSDTVTLPPIPINAKDSGAIYNVTVVDDKTILVEFYSTDSNDIYGYSVKHALNNGSFIQSKFYYFVDSGHQYMHIDSVNTLSDNHYYILYKMDSCLNAVPSKIFRQIQLQGFNGHLKNTLFFNKFEGYPISHYKVFENINNVWVYVDSLSNSDTTYIHKPLLCNNTHQYKVIGYENGGYNRTTSSDTIWLTPFDSIAPDSVVIKYASVVDYSTIELAWKPSNPDVGSYEIWMKTPTNSFALYNIVSKNDSVATITGLYTTDSIYEFIIYAIDSCAANKSKVSKSHVSSIIYAKAGNKKVTLNWQPYIGFASDSQFVEKYINGNWVVIYKTDTASSYLDSNLGCNITNYYRLKTYASNGYISYSDSVFATPFDTVKPMPAKLKFVSIVNGTHVEISWVKSPDVDVKNYEIWRSDNGGAFSKIDDIAGVYSYIDSNTNPQNVKHCYYIVAYDSCSNLNRAISSDTDCTNSIWHSFKGCYPEITLHWTPYQTFETGLFKYRIIRTDSIGNKAYFNINPNSNSYEDSSLVEGSTYCYIIESIDSSFNDTARSFEYCAIPFVSHKPSKANIKYITITQTGNGLGSTKIAWSRNLPQDTLAIGYRLYHSSTSVPSDFTLLYTTTNLNDSIYIHDSINTSSDRHFYYLEIFDYCNRTGDKSTIHSPINLVATAGNLQSSLVWNRYEGWLVSSYDIYRNWTQNGNTYSWYMAQVDSGTFSIVDTNVSCGINYQYIVSANEFTGLYTTLSNYDTSLVFDTIPPLPIKINMASVSITDTVKGAIQIDFNAANEKNKNGYKIYRSIDGNAYTLLNNFINNISGTLIYIDSNINTRNSVHSYYITATDSCGNESTPSDTHTVVNISPVAVNEAVDIHWTSYKGFPTIEYTIERMDDAQLNWIEVVKLPAGSSQFYDSTVICNRVYYYRIATRDISNNIFISYSDTQYVLTFDITAPLPVEFSRVSVSHTSDWNGNVIVEWKESLSKDVAQYVIERRLKDDINWVQAGVTGKVSSFVDAGLNTVDTVYIYRIKAIDSCGNESVYSTTEHGTINLHSTPAEQSIFLNWGAYIGWPVSGYRVYRNGEFLANLDSVTLQYLDTPLTCTQLMNYQVVAFNSIDTNLVSYSDSTVNRAVDHTPPTPTYLKYATVDTSNQQVKLEWNKAGGFDVAYYEIYRKYNGTKGWSKIKTTSTADTVYYDNVDHYDGSLCYRVVSSDSCSNFSMPSNEGCLVYLSGKSGYFLNNLQWNPYTEWKGKVKKYELWKTEDNTPKTLIATIVADSLKWLDSILTYDVRTFCYRVAAHEDTGSYGAISWSNEVCLQQQPIYWIPNAFTPNDDDLNETFGPSGIFIDHYEMTIYDRWGEKVFTSSPQQPRWNGKFNNGTIVPGGLYMYQFKFYSYDGKMYNVPGTVYIHR